MVGHGTNISTEKLKAVAGMNALNEERTGRFPWQRCWERYLMEIVSNLLKGLDGKSPLRHVYDFMDVDGNGVLDVAELSEGLRIMLGANLSVTEVGEMLQGLGDGDDQLTFDEFRELVLHRLDHLERVRTGTLTRAASKAEGTLSRGDVLKAIFGTTAAERGVSIAVANRGSTYTQMSMTAMGVAKRFGRRVSSVKKPDSGVRSSSSMSR